MRERGAGPRMPRRAGCVWERVTSTGAENASGGLRGGDRGTPVIGRDAVSLKPEALVDLGWQTGLYVLTHLPASTALRGPGPPPRDGPPIPCGSPCSCDSSVIAC